ncbi:MAG TPA: tail fiber domain-containing protein [Rhizomicrobium sp.]
MFRKIFVVATLSLLAFIWSPEAEAACSSYPYTLANGTTADATQVMADFNCAVLSGGTYSGVTFNSSTLSGSTAIPNGIINSSGQIGIGTTSTGSSGINVYGTNPSINISQNPAVAGGAALYLSVAGGYGNFSTVNLESFDVFGWTGGAGGYIGDTSHNAWVYFNPANTQFTGSGGTCTISGSGGCTSDARLKTNIRSISGADALAQLSKVTGITFNWADPKLDQKQRVGVLAQSVLKAYPQLIGTVNIKFKGKSGDYYTVDYAGLTAPLISAVNELNRRIALLKSENARQAAEIRDLHSQVVPEILLMRSQIQLLQRKLNIQTASNR